MPPEAFALFGLGLFSGLTICSLGCLAVIGPYLFGTGSGFRDGIHSALAFLLAKVGVYGLLGAAAAVLGRELSIGSGLTSRLLGIGLLAAGLAMPFISMRGCTAGCNRQRRLPLIVLGIVSSLQPCPQLGAVMLIAARQQTIAAGTACGLLYGAGILVSPLLIAAGGISAIGSAIQRQVQKFAPCLRSLAALILIIMGARLLLQPFFIL